MIRLYDEALRFAIKPRQVDRNNNEGGRENRSLRDEVALYQSLVCGEERRLADSVRLASVTDAQRESARNIAAKAWRVVEIAALTIGLVVDVPQVLHELDSVQRGIVQLVRDVSLGQIDDFRWGDLHRELAWFDDLGPRHGRYADVPDRGFDDVPCVDSPQHYNPLDDAQTPDRGLDDLPRVDSPQHYNPLDDAQTPDRGLDDLPRVDSPQHYNPLDDAQTPDRGLDDLPRVDPPDRHDGPHRYDDGPGRAR